MSADQQRPAPGTTVVDVYKGERLAGRLERREAQTVFVYDKAYVGDPTAPAVAFTLPKTDDPKAGAGIDVPAFFAGLLPEGRRLTALATRLKTSVDDTLTMLLAVGADTVGDVRVVLHGETPSAPEPALDVSRVADADFERLFLQSVGAGEGTFDRVGIPGVQAKASAQVISFPVGTRRAPGYILKLNPPEYARLVENEDFFLRAAESCGVESAAAELVTDRKGRSGLLVERFDRVAGDPPRRVAQEDACQVLDRYPGDKYWGDYADLLTALADVSAAPAPALQDLVRQLAFGYLVGNGDLHAKNLSVFEDPRSGLWGPTPAYDVLSTLPYGDTTLALPLAGRRQNATRARFHQLADQIGLRRAAADQVLDQVADGAASWIGDIEEIGFDQRRTHELRKAILYRRDELA